MKLSVVIPALNEEKYIGPCLKAVKKEAAFSGHDIEIVVVDNGSTDCTAAIARSIPGVRVVSEPCQGLSRARHKGYSETHGDLIANVDADCLMPRGYIDKAIRQFEKTPRLACLTGPFYYHDLPATAQIGSTFFYLFAFLPNVLGQRVLGMGAIAQGGNFVVRRTMLDKIGGYDKSISFYGEDADVAIRLSKVGLVRFSMRFQMKTSARRLLKEGVLRAGYFYTLNNIFMIFYHRPLYRVHKDFRET
jgi:glycosyltransferase involved in cell wall biosynthesis